MQKQKLKVRSRISFILFMLICELQVCQHAKGIIQMKRRLILSHVEIALAGWILFGRQAKMKAAAEFPVENENLRSLRLCLPSCLLVGSFCAWRCLCCPFSFHRQRATAAPGPTPTLDGRSNDRFNNTAIFLVHEPNAFSAFLFPSLFYVPLSFQFLFFFVLSLSLSVRNSDMYLSTILLNFIKSL